MAFATLAMNVVLSSGFKTQQLPKKHYSHSYYDHFLNSGNIDEFFKKQCSLLEREKKAANQLILFTEIKIYLLH